MDAVEPARVSFLGPGTDHSPRGLRLLEFDLTSLREEFFTVDSRTTRLVETRNSR